MKNQDFWSKHSFCWLNITFLMIKPPFLLAKSFFLLNEPSFLWAKSPLFECGSRSPWFSHQHHRGQHEPLADVQHAVHVVISAFPGDLHRFNGSKTIINHPGDPCGNGLYHLSADPCCCHCRGRRPRQRSITSGSP
jgi:hypothetical protein